MAQCEETSAGRQKGGKNQAHAFPRDSSLSRITNSASTVEPRYSAFEGTAHIYTLQRGNAIAGTESTYGSLTYDHEL